MTPLRDWVQTLLDQYAAELSHESVAQTCQLLDLGEQALVAQDIIAFGLRRHDLKLTDLRTAREYAAAGRFGRASEWFPEQIDAELSIRAA